MTLTICDLDDRVEKQLRQRAATRQTTVEAEAREILYSSLGEGGGDHGLPKNLEPPMSKEEFMKGLEAVRGIWKERAGGRSTDELMRELRGDD